MNVFVLLLAVFGAGATGTSSFPLLKIGQGPRSAAMGEAFTGLADDASALFWNPAGLGQVRAYQFAVSHQQWFSGVSDEVGQGAFPLGPGRLGVGLLYSGDRGFEGWGSSNEPEGRFNTWSAVVSAGYGLTLFERYQVGAAVKGLTEDLKAERGTGAAVDLGLVAHPASWLGLGVAARHLGTVAYGAVTEKLPTEVAAGVKFGLDRVVGTLDLVVPFDNYPNVRVGIEYLPLAQLAVRVGYRTGPSDLAGLGLASGLTAGLGVTVGDLGLDYAFVPYGRLGLTHRLGLRMALTPVERPELGMLVIDVVDRETRLPLEAYLVLTGVRETTATTSGLKVARVKPGRLVVTAVLGGYEPRDDTFMIAAGRERSFAIGLGRVKFGEIRGGIYDAGTRQAVGGRIVYRGVVYGDERVPPDSGKFRLQNLPNGEYRVGVMGPSEDYIPQSCTLVVVGGRTLERDFHLARKRQTIVLEGVNFESGKADILPQSASILDKAGEILKQTPGIKVELAGHTDPREISTREFPDNWALSRARAEAARRYLVDKWGIAAERMVAQGYADTQPIAPNDSPEGMARNRRTEFRVLEQ